MVPRQFASTALKISSSGHKFPVQQDGLAVRGDNGTGLRVRHGSLHEANHRWQSSGVPSVPGTKQSFGPDSALA
jgi:hypothetical protein